MTLSVGIVTVALTLYGALVAGMYFAQRSLLYHPASERPQPAPELAERVSIQTLPSHDGLALFSWWAAPRDPGGPVIVYFHGNAGSLADREERVALFVDQGWGVLMPSYRYNAGADGRPSEDALIADGAAVLGWLRQQGVAPAATILFGESLGTGIVTALAAETEQAAGLILDAPYDSVLAVAQAKYWYLPVRWLLKDQFRSLERIPDVSIPLLIGHGGEDRVIPAKHGRRLFDAANQPKTFAFKPEGRHTNLFEYGFFDDVVRFVAAVTTDRQR